MEKKIDYELIGRTLWHKGLGETIKVIAAQTENEIDDKAAEIVDSIVDKVFPEFPPVEIQP